MGIEFDVIVIVSLLPSHCGFFFVPGYKVCFSVGSRNFAVVVDGCSEVSCDFGVLVRRDDIIFFYSAILLVNCKHCHHL